MVPSHPGALVLAPSTTSSSHHRRNDGAGAGGGGNGPLESWLRASRAIAGGAAFLLALAGAHVTQGRLGVSAANPLLAPTAGILAVGLGSLSASFAADRAPALVCAALRVALPPGAYGAHGGWTLFAGEDMEGDPEAVALRAMRTALVGALLFKGLGGSFRGLAPSDVCRPGAFFRRRGTLPATMDYASPLQKRRIDAFGLLYGCHTCGRRQVGDFIGDHMPPRKVAAQMSRRWWRRLLRLRVTQRFAPQCRPCSQRQASAVREGKRVLVSHHWGLGSLRRYHATGGVAEGLRVFVGDQYLDAKMEELLAAARSVFPSWLGGGGGASSSSSLLDRLQRRSK